MSQCTDRVFSTYSYTVQYISRRGLRRGGGGGPWPWACASDPAQTHDHFITQISRISTVGLRPYCASQRAASLCCTCTTHVSVIAMQNDVQCLSAGSGTVRVVCGHVVRRDCVRAKMGVPVLVHKPHCNHHTTVHTDHTLEPSTCVCGLVPLAGGASELDLIER